MGGYLILVEKLFRFLSRLYSERLAVWIINKAEVFWLYSSTYHRPGLNF